MKPNAIIGYASDWKDAMRASMDLCRTLLETIEDTDTPREVDFSKIDVSKDQINYHINLLYEAGFIRANFSGNTLLNGLNWTVYGDSITLNGTSFLGRAKPPDRWKKAKEILEKGGSFTLDAMKQILIELANQQIEGIKKQIGL